LIDVMIISILEFSPILIIAGMGQLLSQKSGVYNLGIEGIMTSGAVFAVLAFFLGLGSWESLLFGTFIGLIFGALLFILSEKFKLDQIVIGFGIWFLSLGVANALFATVLSGEGLTLARFEPLIFSLNPMVFFAFALVAIFIYIYSKTNFGLSVIAVGEDPKVADTSGINVERIRGISVIVGSGLIGLAGAYFAVHVLQGFTYVMLSGYGWVAFAIVLFARWRASYVLFGSLFFTAITTIVTRLNILGITLLPLTFMGYLPHIAVLVGLTLTMIFGKKSGMPAALGTPYKKEEK